MIYKRAESKFYWVRIEKGSVIIQRSTKCVLKRDAKEFEAKLRLAEFGPDGPRGARTLAEFWPELEEHWTQTLTSPRTLKFYRDAIRPVLEFEPLAKCQLHHIKQPLVVKFFTERLKLGLARATCNHSIRSLRRALHIAAEEKGYIAAAPPLSLLENEHKRDAVVSETDFQRILAACGWTTQENEGEPRVANVGKETLRALMTLMFDGGLPAGEACRVEWKNVDLERRFVDIDFGKTKAAKRRVPLTTRTVAALAALRVLRPDARYCFTRRDGDRPLTVVWISHRFMRMRRDLKMPDGVVLHSLRHSCATRYGNTGQCNVLDLMKIMGWETAEIAKRYVHLDDARLAAMAELLEV